MKKSVSIFSGWTGPAGMWYTGFSANESGGRGMENTPQDPAHLRREFQPCRNRFTAFGGETRQDLLRVLLSPPPAGSAGDRRDKSPKRSDSRLLALQDSGIENVARLFADILQILRNAPDKSGED